MTSISLAAVRHVVLDLDGTLYRGSRLFEATLPFLAQLKAWNLGVTFLTNNTSRSKADYVAKLGAFGISAREHDIYTPADSTLAHLRDRLPYVRTIAVLGTPSLRRQFEQAGYSVTWDEPQAVIVGFDTTLTYERLCKAAYWIARDLPYVATHPDLVCPTDESTVLVDCGAICACLNAATGRSPLVLGKPDPVILLDLCTKHGLRPGQLAMVGDRIYTDVAMAQRAGVIAVLVLSGEATADEAAAMSTPADLVVANVGELGRHMAAARRGS
jgi:HAD superfamily hydrolase (TIGR01450 family)